MADPLLDRIDALPDSPAGVVIPGRTTDYGGGPSGSPALPAVGNRKVPMTEASKEQDTFGGLAETAISAAPAIAGSAIGGAAGGLPGAAVGWRAGKTAGGLLGAGAGGAAGEFLGQKAGLSEESSTMVGAAGMAGAAGPLLGSVFRAGAKLGAKSFLKTPYVAEGVYQGAARDAAQDFKQLGTHVIEGLQGTAMKYSQAHYLAKGQAAKGLATQRGELDTAIKQIEGAIGNHMERVAGTKGDFTMKGMVALGDKLSALKDNPAFLKQYERYPALREQLESAIKTVQRLEVLEDRAGIHGGSLVFRGLAAAMGAGIGKAFFGNIGAGIGALKGAQGPEMATAWLLTPKGRKVIEMAARTGQRTIRPGVTGGVAQTIGQLVTQGGQAAREGVVAKDKTALPETAREPKMEDMFFQRGGQ